MAWPLLLMLMYVSRCQGSGWHMVQQHHAQNAAKQRSGLPTGCCYPTHLCAFQLTAVHQAEAIVIYPPGNFLEKPHASVSKHGQQNMVTTPWGATTNMYLCSGSRSAVSMSCTGKYSAQWSHHLSLHMQNSKKRTVCSSLAEEGINSRNMQWQLVPTCINQHTAPA